MCMIMWCKHHMVTGVFWPFFLCSPECCIADNFHCLYDHMVTYQVAAPESFVFSNPAEWSKWIQHFEWFRIASGIDKHSEETQVNTIWTTRPKTFFVCSDCQTRMLKSAVLLKPSVNLTLSRSTIIYERVKFNQCKQEEDETVDAFVMALYELAEHCSYGNLHDEMIRDRLVVGSKMQNRHRNYRAHIGKDYY